jgi:hydrogenase-4 component B
MALFLAYCSVVMALMSGVLALAAGQRSGLQRITAALLNAKATHLAERFPKLPGYAEFIFTKERYPSLLRQAVFVLLGTCGVFAVLGGIAIMAADGAVIDQLSYGLPWLSWHVRFDSLSGFFHCVIGIAVIAVALYGPGYVNEFEESKHPFSVLGLFTGLFVAGMLLVPLADDAFFFVIAWELMSVASYFLVTWQHEHSANRRAGFIYLLMAEVGAIALILAFGVLAGFSGGLTFAAIRSAELTPLWASIAFSLALLGYGMKAGLVPIHVWLPEAHPVAPSHISALMSGVMLKVAVYGFIRFAFDLLGDMQWQWGLAVLILGTASAVLGVLYAIMQHNLKRLLAYHSVENIGIIFMGLGLSMIFASSGHPKLAVLGLLAALFHTLNHALFKSLLFLGAGAILHQTHEADIERMGGLIHRMPKTAALFLIGCVAISALPLFNGFVSEWLTFQAALQAGVLESGVLRSLVPITAAVLALTGALAAACFVKVYGVVFLGAPRSSKVSHAREVRSRGMLAGPALLAALCFLFGIFPTPVINGLNSVAGNLLNATLPSVSAMGWLWLTPVSSDVASYSAPLVLLAALLAGTLVSWVLHRVKETANRRADLWECGFGGVTPRMQYTSSAFSMPLRRIFKTVWEVDETIVREPAGAKGQRTAVVRYQLHIGDHAWRFIYHPIAHAVTTAARHVGKIQTGNIRVYLSYSFFTLLFLLWVIS